MSNKIPIKREVLYRIRRRKKVREHTLFAALAMAVCPAGDPGKESLAKQVERGMKKIEPRYFGRRAKRIRLAIQHRALEARKTDQRARTSWRT